MKTSIIALICLVGAGLIFEVHHLHKAAQETQEKLEEQTAALEQVNKSLQFNDKLIQQKIEDEKNRDSNFSKILIEKKNHLKALREKIDQLNQHPDLDHQRALAADYLKKEKAKVDDLKARIAVMESGKHLEQNGEKQTQQEIDAAFHQQDAALDARIKLEQQTLNSMKTQLSQMYVNNRIALTREARDTQKQAVDNQAQVVANYTQQRKDLGIQHKRAIDDLHISTNEDAANANVALASLRDDLATEKKYYDEAEKANQAAQKGAEGIKSQIQELNAQILVLQNEIRELEIAR